jgi:hypothetical protein
VLMLTASNLACKFSFIRQGMNRSIKSDPALFLGAKLKTLFSYFFLRTGAHDARLISSSSASNFLKVEVIYVLCKFEAAVIISVQMSSAVVF